MARAPIKTQVQLAAAELRARLRNTNTAKQFGFELVEASPGRAILSMHVDERHKPLHGVVHGGVLAALADTAGGLASYMACPRGTRVGTGPMEIKFFVRGEA